MERNKTFCQTCLSNGRAMQPFAKLKHLLKELNLEIQDTGAVCWECRRVMDNFYRFKIQVSEAQQLLHKQGEMLDLPSLSRLNVGPNHCYDSLKFFPSSWESLPKGVVIKQEPIDVDEYPTNDDEMAHDFIQPLDGNVSFDNNVISVEREPAVWSELPKITLVESISESRNSVTDLTTNVPQSTPAQANIQNIVNSEQNITLSDSSGVIDVEAVQIIVIKEEVLDPKEQECDGNDGKNTQNPEGDDEAAILRCKRELDGTSRADNVALDRAIWKKSAMHICCSLREHKYASCFHRPITDDIAPEYSKIVRRPMDLATIKRNIKNDVIRTTPEFERDVLLMLTNALMYNSSDHYVYDMTKDFYQEAQNQLELLLSINARPTSVPITRTKRRLEEIENIAKRPKIFNTTPISQLTNMTPKLPRGILNTAKSAKKQKSATTPAPSSLQTKPNINIKKELAIVIPKLELTEYLVKRKPGRPPKSKQSLTPAIQMKKEIPQSTRKSERLRIKKEPKEIVIQKPEPKRKKRKSNKTYKDDGNDYYLDDLSVAITAENANDFKDQANFIKRLLEDTIRSLALNAENFAPKFRGEPIISDGVIKLWCEDRNTLKWLTDTVKKLPSKLGRLSVIRQVDLPKKLQSALSVPGSENDEVIKKVLKVQNPWAQIDSWSFYSAEQRGDNMFFLLGIPSTVIPVLLARQRRLAYNLGSVFVQFFSGAGTLTETPELAWL